MRKIHLLIVGILFLFITVGIVTAKVDKSPTAVAGSDQTVDEDIAVNFDGSGSSDDVDIASYSWDFDDSDGITVDATGATPTHTYNDPGTYIVTLTVTDSDSNSDTDTLKVTVNDATSPTTVVGPDQTVNEDTIVHFNGSGSSDNVGITSYSWDFDDSDGITVEANGATPTHTYLNPGIHIVTLTVSDSDGNYANDTLTVTVKDTTSPTAIAGSDQTVNEDIVVTFDGSGSSDNVGITSYSWDFDASNGITVDATGATPTHTYNDPGTYIVTLNVSDSAGNYAADALTVIVKDASSPTADAGPDQTVNEGTVVHFNGFGSYDDVGIASYFWDFDASNGITVEATGATPSHTYLDPGTYTVTLKVSDSAGNYANDTLTVTVKDTTTPIAVAGTDQIVKKNIVVHFDGSGSSDDVGVVSYSWDFDISNGITVDAIGAITNHTYSNLGTYTVTLNVSDSDGKYATDTLIITVNDVTTTINTSGGSSGSSGTSGEAFENIICTETDRRFISKDHEVSFNFELECNYVKYINFTSLISFGKEATKVEILNHTSSLVSKDAPDLVFINLNVWIGSMGLISENNVENPTISFNVDKSWVKDNGITLNTIYLYSYDDYTTDWEKMSTQKIGEDSSSYYYKASLPVRKNIGPLAISGSNLSSPSMVSSNSSSIPLFIPTQTATVQPTQKNNTTSTPITWTSNLKEKVPPFQVFLAFFVIISSYIVGIKWDKMDDTNIKINGELINPLFINIVHPIVIICFGYVLMRLMLYILDVTNIGVGWLEANQVSSFLIIILILVLSLLIIDAAVTLGRRRLGDDKYSLAESGISLAMVNIKKYKELPAMVDELSRTTKKLPTITKELHIVMKEKSGLITPRVDRPSNVPGSFWHKEPVRKITPIKVPAPMPGRTSKQKLDITNEDEEQTPVPEHSRPITKKYIYFDKLFSESPPEVGPDTKPNLGPNMEKRPKGP